MRPVLADAQELPPGCLIRQKLDPLDEPGPAVGIRSAGKERGKREKELVEEPRPEQATDHRGTSLRQDNFMAFAPKGWDHVNEVDGLTVAQREDG